LKIAHLTVALGLLAASPALAQPPGLPQEIPPDMEFSLGVGEAKTLRFGSAIGKVETLNEGIARVSAQSDHVLTLFGVAPGGDHLIVFGPDGQQFFSADISVAPAAGHLVKLYGHRGKDYVGWYCSETGCGRADLDKTLANHGIDPDDPTAESRTVTRPTGDGGSVSKTKQYGPQ
jgi:hypothetical protein